jgi:hypothetical protein
MIPKKKTTSRKRTEAGEEEQELAENQ